MPKEEWGVKRVCPTTGKRFYDLNRNPIVSPYTGEIVVIDLPGRKGALGSLAEAAKAKAKLAVEIEGDDALIDDDVAAVDAADELLEDDDDDDTVGFDELTDVAAEDDEV